MLSILVGRYDRRDFHVSITLCRHNVSRTYYPSPMFYYWASAQISPCHGADLT